MIKKVLGAALICSAFATNISTAASISDSLSNDSLATAQNINLSFSTEFNPNIGDSLGNNTSLSSRHVSIKGLGGNAYDYFLFSVPQVNTIGRFDIDLSSSLDSAIALWDSLGNNIAFDDDSSITEGAGGSTATTDSFIEHSFSSTGAFYVGVARFGTDAELGRWELNGNVLLPGDNYTLQVSLESPAPVPVPAAIWLLGSGLIGFISFGRRTA